MIAGVFRLGLGLTRARVGVLSGLGTGLHGGGGPNLVLSLSRNWIGGLRNGKGARLGVGLFLRGEGPFFDIEVVVVLMYDQLFLL